MFDYNHYRKLSITYYRKSTESTFSSEHKFPMDVSDDYIKKFIELELETLPGFDAKDISLEDCIGVRNEDSKNMY